MQICPHLKGRRAPPRTEVRTGAGKERAAGKATLRGVKRTAAGQALLAAAVVAVCASCTHQARIAPAKGTLPLTANGASGRAESAHRGESEHSEAQSVKDGLAWFNRRHPDGGLRAKAVAEMAQALRANANSSSWTSIGPQPISPGTYAASGRVWGIAIDPTNYNTVYIGTDGGGVWKTTDAGTTWTPMTDTQANINIRDLALVPSSPSHIYAATAGGGLLSSTDGGNTWTSIYPANSYYLDSVTVHPTNGSIVLAATGYSVVRSADGGNTWTTPLSTNGVQQVVFDPSNGSVAYAASYSTGVYRSSDSGATWTLLAGTGLPAPPYSGWQGGIDLAIAPSSSNILYLALKSSSTDLTIGFYRSTDSGSSWSQISSPPANAEANYWGWSMRVHPSNPNLIYAGTVGLVRSTDGGSTWAFAENNVHVDQHILVYTPDGNTLYLGNDGGIYSTANPAGATVTWTNLNNTLSTALFYPGISIDPTNINRAFGGTQDNGTLAYQGNLGWPERTCGDGGYTALDFNNSQNVYAACQNISVNASTDGGSTFHSAISGINTNDRVDFIAPLVMDPSNPQRLYFATYRLYQTTNGASSWTAISGDLTTGSDAISVIGVAPSNPNVVYTGSVNARISVTQNALSGTSSTWTTCGLLPSGTYSPTQISVDPANPQIAWVTVASGSNRVYLTTNGCSSWTAMGSGLPDIPVDDILIDPDIANTLYVATDVGVYRSSDGGHTWAPLGTGLPHVIVHALKLHEVTRTLRAATYGRGMWDISVPTTSCVSIPASGQYSYSGGSASITVTSINGCSWSATSTVSWITITSGGSGSGNGTVTFSIAANPLNTPRTGYILVGGQAYIVTQLARFLITTVAGGLPPPTAFPGTSSLLALPQGSVSDSAGNVYISATRQNAVFKLDTTGMLSRIAGTGATGLSGDGGAATAAQLNQPLGLALDGSGNLYIADSGNNRVRKVSAAGILTTFAGGNCCSVGDGGAATSAWLSGPSGVAADASGNVYIADQYSQRIRMVSGGVISTVAGNGTLGYSGDSGPATNAMVNYPFGVAVDGSGNLYIADTNNGRIRKVTGGVITTIAGSTACGLSGDGGLAVNAQLCYPRAVTVTASGALLIADSSNGRIRQISTGGIISTVAGGVCCSLGDGGLATQAWLNWPSGVTADAAGNIYIAETNSERIRKVGTSGLISTVAGGGSGVDYGVAPLAAFAQPQAVAADASGNLYVADSKENVVRKVTASGAITTIAGNGAAALAGDGGPATSASLNSPSGLAFDAAGNLYIADSYNQRIREVSTTGTITTFAGTYYGYGGDNGQAVNAQFAYPNGIAFDSSGNLFVADSANARVRKIATNGVVTTVAGNGTAGYTSDGIAATSAELNYPQFVAVDASGNLYIGDSSNYRVRKVATNGIITTYAGTGAYAYSGDGGAATSASLSYVSGLVLDTAGYLYLSEQSYCKIRVVSPGGIIDTAAGNGTAGYSGDGGPSTAAMVSSPQGLAIDGSGRIYIADQNNLAIRALFAPLGQAALSVQSAHSGSFSAGQSGATYTLTVSNSSAAGATSGTVTVTDFLSTGLTLASMSGTGWTCGSGSCTRSDSLAAGGSYAAITVTVNVSATAPSQATNAVVVSGGGGFAAGAADLTVVTTAPTLATMSSPTPGSTLAGSSVTFNWNAGNGATAYWLDVGTVQGQGNISAGQMANTVFSRTVTGIPANGANVYVRLWTQFNGSSWQYNDYTYGAAGTQTLATISSPATGGVLWGSSVTFNWNAGTGATAYWLDVGSVHGQGNISAGQLANSVTAKSVSGIPTDGSTIYVRLWTQFNGSSWQYNDYVYLAASSSQTLATMNSPAPGSTLSATTTFTWNPGGGATAYWLDVGTVRGQGNISAGQLTNTVTSKTVSGIPGSGPIYVRLWTQFSGTTWQYIDYLYSATLTQSLAAMSSPTAGTALFGTTVTFTWNAGAGATAYWLDVGTVHGQGNISAGQLSSSVLSKAVTGIAMNGAAVYVRLWTQFNGSTWQYNDYVYLAATPTLATMSSPTPGSTLAGASVTFTWKAGLGATAYWLDVGTVQGQGNISAGQLANTVLSQAVTGIPVNGAPIYVRLWTQFNGSSWQYIDYTYTAY